MSFSGRCEGSVLRPRRSFALPRNAAVDSAIVVNHLRNCATIADGLEFKFGEHSFYEIQLDECVHLWINKLLGAVGNQHFRCPKLFLRLRHLNAASAVDLMAFTRNALCENTKSNALSNISLDISYEALEALTVAHFLQWPYMQNLEDIRLQIVRLRLSITICVFGMIWCAKKHIIDQKPFVFQQLLGSDAPGDPIWIGDFFQLPNCKTIVVTYTTVGYHGPDCSEQIFVVLRNFINVSRKSRSF